MRVFEKISGCEVVCFFIVGLMGVYGVVLIVLDVYEIGEEIMFFFLEELVVFIFEKEFIYCGLCENNC